MSDFYRKLTQGVAFPNDKATPRVLRECFCSEFQSFYSELGMQQHPAGTLIPENDNSVMFTGSTISTFKPVLMSGDIPERGLFMIQHCLRTQNAMRIQDGTFQPKWSSAFLSTGTLSRYEELDKVSVSFWLFLTERLGLNADDIRIHIASSDEDLLRPWIKAGLEEYLVIDTKESVYYTHKFGIDGVSGRNCNIAVQGSNSGEFRDFGNIIVIETEQKKLALEMALGVDTAISRMLGLPTPIHAAPIAEFLPLESNEELKVADAVAASTLILRNGIKPVATNRGRVLRRYLQGIGELQPVTTVALSDLQAASEGCERVCFGSPSDAGRFLVDYVERYQALKGINEPNRGKLNRRLTEVSLKI